MELLFWLSIAWLLYIYLGYPLILKCLPSTPKAVKPFDDLPDVTVLIPAYNEAGHIAETVNNKLTQDYPADKLQVIVISDESTDGTDELVQAIAAKDSRVTLIRQQPRQGKTAGLNLALQNVDSDIVVFSDANSQFAPDAVQALVKTFEDPSVGYVTGKMVYTQDGSIVGDGCSAYMRYENWLRTLETRTGSVVGVDGGVDAIRRELYQPMNPDQLPDFVQPLKVVSQGFRVAYCETALLNEEALNDSQSEFRMRVRVSLRALWALWDMRHLFNPRQYGVFSWQLLSHKALRYLAFVPMATAFLSNALLSGTGTLYTLLFFGQLGCYGLAAYAQLFKSDNRIAGLCNYFCLINLASFVAFTSFVRGEKIVIWQPRVG